jgi:hypothetical protein
VRLVLVAVMIVWFPVSGLAAQERASDRPDEPEPATVFARHGTDRIWLSGQVNDGGLTYGREQIVEAYYTVHFWRGLFASADLQHIANPGRIAVPYWSSARVCISISSDRRPRCSAPRPTTTSILYARLRHHSRLHPVRTITATGPDDSGPAADHQFRF